MESMSSKKRISYIISSVFNGFTTMMCAPILAFLLSPITDREKIFLSVLYILLPVVPYLIMRKMGKISDMDITDRRERPVFFMILSILFFCAFLYIRTFGIEIMTDVTFALFATQAILMLVTFFWKMSGHMTSSVYFFCTLYYLFPFLYVLPIFLFVPLIAWSRVVLKKHTIAQVIVGTVVTFVVCVLIYWIY